MEFKKRTYKIKLSLFIFFLMLMLLCTIVSRGIYANALPKVSVDKPRNMSLIYQFVSEGVTAAEHVSAINIEEGLVIKEILVKEGNRIEVGDSIVKLNLEFLRNKIYDIELSIKSEQRQLDQYQNYLKQDGVITSDVEGVVTNIGILAGEYTGRSSVILVANVEQNLRFVTQITQSQRDLISIGDTVEINFEQMTLTDVVISSIEENEANGNSYEVAVAVPAQDLTIGKRGFLQFKKVSKSYLLCVPIDCIYSEGIQNYIFVLNEGESILGEELRVEKRYVTILEQNENYVALEESSGISDNKVIIFSSKRLEDGEQVRME